jgi:hypothetical protein
MGSYTHTHIHINTQTQTQTQTDTDTNTDTDTDTDTDTHNLPMHVPQWSPQTTIPTVWHGLIPGNPPPRAPGALGE